MIRPDWFPLGNRTVNLSCLAMRRLRREASLLLSSQFQLGELTSGVEGPIPPPECARPRSSLPGKCWARHRAWIDAILLRFFTGNATLVRRADPMIFGSTDSHLQDRAIKRVNSSRHRCLAVDFSGKDERPRAQRYPNSRGCPTRRRPFKRRTLLRPRTGALRRLGSLLRGCACDCTLSIALPAPSRPKRFA